MEFCSIRHNSYPQRLVVWFPPSSMPVFSIMEVPQVLQMTIIKKMRYESFAKFYKSCKYMQAFCDENNDVIRIYPEIDDDRYPRRYESRLQFILRGPEEGVLPRLAVRLSKYDGTTKSFSMQSSPEWLANHFALFVLDHEMRFFVFTTILFTVKNAKHAQHNLFVTACVSVLEEHKIKGIKMVFGEAEYIPRMLATVKPRFLIGLCLDPRVIDPALISSLNKLRILQLRPPKHTDLPLCFDVLMEKFEKLHGILDVDCSPEPPNDNCDCNDVYMAFCRLVERLRQGDKSISVGVNFAKLDIQHCSVARITPVIPECLSHLGFNVFTFRTTANFMTNPMTVPFFLAVGDGRKDKFRIMLASAQQKRFLALLRFCDTHVAKAIDTWDELMELIPLALNDKNANYFTSPSSLSPKLHESQLRAFFL